MVAEFLKADTDFAELISGFEDEKLDAPFVNEEYESYQRNIEAMIEHGYYHLVQVVLLRKLLIAR